MTNLRDPASLAAHPGVSWDVPLGDPRGTRTPWGGVRGRAVPPAPRPAG